MVEAIEATLRVPVHPTELGERVEQAVRAIFPPAMLQSAPGELVGRCADLARFAQLVREQRIPDTARSVLLRARSGAETRFALSKQAAAAGRLNFAARPGPLGDIEVVLRAPTPEALDAFIDEAAPDTRAWTLEVRGLTEKGLRAQEADEAVLDDELGRDQ